MCAPFIIPATIVVSGFCVTTAGHLRPSKLASRPERLKATAGAAMLPAALSQRVSRLARALHRHCHRRSPCPLQIDQKLHGLPPATPHMRGCVFPGRPHAPLREAVVLLPARLASPCCCCCCCLAGTAVTAAPAGVALMLVVLAVVAMKSKDGAARVSAALLSSPKRQPGQPPAAVM